MTISYWGTRGSLTTITRNTQVYGGNTSCVTVEQGDTLLILDAGSGIVGLGEQLSKQYPSNVHILLTHLHMDHIQGLGFFQPFFHQDKMIHLWGPPGSSTLAKRLNRYLSPPLFPVRIRDFECDFHLQEIPLKPFTIGPFEIKGSYICHPGPTLGYRISNGSSVMAYLPDHDPALGVAKFPGTAEWTSGYSLAEQADVLIHDAQFTDEEYESRQSWGHCTYTNAIKFAELANVKRLELFHHDPSHTDTELEALLNRYVDPGYTFEVHLAKEGSSLELADRT